MRRKNWKNPGTVYVDSQVFEENIQVYASFEVFLEILEGLYSDNLETSRLATPFIQKLKFIWKINKGKVTKCA